MYKTERDSQAWLRDQTYSDQRGQGWGEMSQEFGINIYTGLYVK